MKWQWKSLTNGSIEIQKITVKKILKQIEKHRGFQRYLKKHRGQPKIFISEVQNKTSNAYFPIDDFNDEMLNEFFSIR